MSGPGGEVNADTSVIATQAENFRGIGTELNREMNEVQSTGEELLAVWQGESSRAARIALDHFYTAADKQRLALEEISESIGLSGIDYTSTDEDQAAVLARSMIPPS